MPHSKQVVRVKPTPALNAAAEVHRRAAALQHAAGGAGVRVNRAATAAAKPLARGGKGLRRVHRAGAVAAKTASKAMAGCADGARANIHMAADAALEAVGRKPSARAAVDIGVGVFEMAAAAPVFLAQALHSPPFMHHSKPPKPHVQALPSPPPKPKPTHHWVNGHWVPLQTAVDANGVPYQPPPGYPAAKKKKKRRSKHRAH